MKYNKGYVIFLTENWLSIVSNLINSVLLFSKYNIEVNCINFNHDFNNDRIKSKNIYLNNPDFFNITKCKIISTIESDFDIGLILDGDMIVTSDIDNVFFDNEDRILTCKFPLFAKHPHNPFESYKHITSKVSNTSNKMKWVYSNYLFAKHHKWFFTEILNYMNSVPDSHHSFFYPVPEESIINALLSKYQVDYDLGYNYFPNGFKHVIEHYLNYNKDGEQHIQETYLNYDCPIKFYAFHGHDIKNTEYGKYVIQQLLQKKIIFK